MTTELLMAYIYDYIDLLWYWPLGDITWAPFTSEINTNSFEFSAWITDPIHIKMGCNYSPTTFEVGLHFLQNSGRNYLSMPKSKSSALTEMAHRATKRWYKPLTAKPFQWKHSWFCTIDQSHRYGRPQAACREPAGSYDKTTRTAICFEHKTQYLLIRAPYTRIVVFWHISNIPPPPPPPMISQSQISCNTPTFYIAAIFVKYCYRPTTGSWLS